MTTSITQAAEPLTPLIDEFEHTHNPRRLEYLADRLAALGDRRALHALLARLCDWQVQHDEDVEDAVCSALVSFSVMRRLGNQRFAFLPEHLLARDAVDAISDLDQSIPVRYFLAPTAE